MSIAMQLDAGSNAGFCSNPVLANHSTIATAINVTTRTVLELHFAFDPVPS